MIVNKAALNAVFRSLRTLFNDAFKSVETQWDKIAMKVPSNTKSNDYKWLSSWPKMRKWIGDKQVDSLAAHKYTVVNDDFEVTIAVARNDIKDDQLGMYAPQAKSAGQSAAELPEEIVADLFNGMFTNLCFDGQYFADTDHPVGDGTVSNKLTVALSCATQALAIASLGAARTTMRKFKDDKGRPLGCRPNVLVVAPHLEDIASVLMTNDKLDDGKPNPFKGTMKLVVLDRATSDTAWAVLDTGKPVMPFIYQEREAPEFVQQTSVDSEEVFMRGNFLYGAEARAAGGYGFWQLCVASTGAG